MIKTFRGLLASGGQERIRLSTPTGKVGYKIIKFQQMAALPGTTSYEHTTKIYSILQTAASIENKVDFSDSTLLAAAYLEGSSSAGNTDSQAVIFDQEIFNQDIYVTQYDSDSAGACNYYIELEVIPLSDQGAEYTTIKDLRANA